MVLFVAGAFAPTERPRPKHGDLLKRVLRDGELGYWEVLAVASAWDDEGDSTPEEFVEALACEIEGTPEYANVQENMTRTVAQEDAIW